MEKILRVFDNYKKCRSDFERAFWYYEKEAKMTVESNSAEMRLKIAELEQEVRWIYLRERKDSVRLKGIKVDKIVIDEESKFHIDNFIELTQLKQRSE